MTLKKTGYFLLPKHTHQAGSHNNCYIILIIIKAMITQLIQQPTWYLINGM